MNRELIEMICVQNGLDPTKVSHAIVAAILDDLTDRSGLEHTWDDIDRDIQLEIVATWVALVEELLP